MIKPTFKLIYGHKDITKDIADFVLSIEYTDKEHGEADEVQITLEDSQRLWQGAWIPVKGDTIRLYIGYDGDPLLNCGLFEIDEVELSSPPDILVIKGIGTPIKKPLRQNNAIAYENKNLRQIAQEVANRNRLQLKGDIEDIRVQRITQNSERDLTFLRRLAEEYGYIFKVQENSIIFYQAQKLRATSPVKILYRSDLTRYSMSEKTSQKYKAVQVSYHNPKTKKAVKTTVKNKNAINGDTLKITVRAENKQQAILKAKAAMAKGDTGKEGSFEMCGDPSIVAGANVELKDLAHFSGKYHLKQAKHTIDKSSGYKVGGEVESC